MLHAIVSDVHANLEALERVLTDIEKRKVKQIVFLGDAVGYGPNPNETTSILKETCSVLLAGNHDRVAVGLESPEFFNPIAKAAVLWTASVLTEENKNTIKEFRMIKILKNILFVHSTPKEPEQWHYLLSYPDAEVNFECFKQWICFLGHSHTPFILERLPSGEISTYGETARLYKENRYIINVGSVGQPRDRDPRACYALLNGENVELIRVDYPIKETQRKMQEAGLPDPLIQRLSSGV